MSTKNEQKPIPNKRGRDAKYPWDRIRECCWFEWPIEASHQDQGCSIRAAAKAQGLRVSVRRCEHEWLVEIKGKK